MKVAIIYGGKSPEHNVSINSAFSIIKNFDFSKYSITPIYITHDGQWKSKGIIKKSFKSKDEMIINDATFELNKLANYDVVFPILSGSNGEDGSIQGLFEIVDVPYVGNGVAASAICMDKVLMKTFFSKHNIPQVNYLWWNKNEWMANHDEIYNQIESIIKFPCYVKASNLGSSIGVFKCFNREELSESMGKAFLYSSKVLVEESIIAREIELSALGNLNFEYSVAGEINNVEENFYDYDMKYNSGLNVEIPAQIDKHIYKEMKNIADKCSLVVGNEGLFRADFFLTKDGKIFVNELNTFPGFTETSMYPLLWIKSGLSYSNLINKLIELAIDKYKTKTTYISNI